MREDRFTNADEETPMNRKSAVLAALLAAGTITAVWAADSVAYTVTTVALPGGGPTGISMDYLGYDPATNSVWVPAGNTGSVDVVDAATRKVTQLSGLPAGEMGSGDRKRTVGPS